MELVAAIYKAGGLDELIILAALGATLLLLRAHVTRQNAESHAIETNSQLARDSTTRLNVREEAYRTLQENCAQQGRELEKAYALLTLSDTELSACRNMSEQLKKELSDAQADNKSLRHELNELKRQSQE
jgi:hypothetical protein